MTRPVRAIYLVILLQALASDAMCAAVCATDQALVARACGSDTVDSRSVNLPAAQRSATRTSIHFFP
jgi:hypothetical protein